MTVLFFRHFKFLLIMITFLSMSVHDDHVLCKKVFPNIQAQSGLYKAVKKCIIHRQTGIMELKHKKRHYCTDKHNKRHYRTDHLHAAFSVMLLTANNLSSLKHPDWFWDVLFNGCKRLSLELKRPGCKLTTHFRLVVRLRMNGAIPPGPPCAYMADTGSTLPLHCKGYKGSGIYIGTMYRRLGFLLTFPTHYVTGC